MILVAENAIVAGASSDKRCCSITSKHRISKVKPIPGKHALEIEWDDGKRFTVDLIDHINTFLALEPLRDLVLFGRVKVGKWGVDVNWTRELELPAATLHRLAMKQAD
ncbi:DUF2442 domain-containing protein [Pseudomonas azotoformans]|uniref:DUF2442 domain-containing protein n=1 Tax=Pseudomonas azotoformans TaxID=47878 RepID=A0A127I6F7_PSEAZ|nr:DUF2442 domain-containing protein [Pseudomonas azotoformans]AMN82293.1 hypothetical protein AYR47_30070 [Pseudomonas azotoformans]